MKEGRSDNGGSPGLAGIPISVVRWGVAIFVAASVLGFAAAFFISKDWTTELQSFRRFNPIWFVPAAGLMLLDWIGAGIRFKILIRPQERSRNIGINECTQIAVVGIAMGYLTPSSTGSGPANIYGLMRQGLSFGRAAAVNAAGFLSNVIFLSVSGLTAWALGINEQMAHIRLPVANLSAAALFRWTAWVFGGAVIVIVILTVIPGIARAIIRRIMGSDHPRIERILHHFDELHDGLLTYWHHGKLAFLLAISTGVIHFGARFVLGWVVVKGFVASAPFVEVTLLHMVITYLLFVMPTPGGTGGGEVITAVVMAPFLPGGLMLPYTAVWRVFLTYGTLAAGTALMLAWLGKDGAR